jgi:glycerol-1-phosphate dehydrogenase [NAD(P)+]
MPLLARLVNAPLVVDVRRGAVEDLGALLKDQRIATEGRVAIAVGPGQGDSILASLDLANAEVFRIEAGTVDDAVTLGKQLRAGNYEAVAGIGGGRTIDVTKFGAHMAGIPMVAVATNLAHDGIASPVSSLEHESGKGSYGVVAPAAAIVDLDRVRQGDPRMVRAGVGDVVCKLSAIADWELSGHDTGEQIDGLAVTLARTAAEAVLHQPGTIADDGFLTVLAESLIMCGLAMSVAGSSRPCSGGDHEIMHAIDQLFPATANHGELAGLGALFCSFLRHNEAHFSVLHTCLGKHGLPRTPAEAGLTAKDFTRAVLHAPATRPGRYTILEKLSMSSSEAAGAVAAFEEAVHAVA